VVEPRLGMFMPPTLEVEVGIWTKVRSNLRKPLGFRVVKILIIHQTPKQGIFYEAFI